MRPARRFATLHASALRRITKLRRLANDALQKPHNEISLVNCEISFVCIELHSLVSNFTRAYFLSCVLSPVTEFGVKVTCNSVIRNYADAIDASMKACRNRTWRQANGNRLWDRRDEPPWHRPSTLMDSLREINSSNYSNVVGAFSIQTNVFEHLTIFRNFFAHRNESTLNLAQNIALSYTILPNQHPYQILLNPPYNRPQELIFDWMDDLTTTIELLCS